MDSFTIPAGNGLERRITTPLQEAVYVVAGGPTRFVELADIAAHKLEYLLKIDRQVQADADGRIRSLTDVEDAEMVVAVTTRLERPVPLLELLGLEPWRGPRRHGSDPNRDRAPKDRAPSGANGSVRSVTSHPARDAAAHPPVGKLGAARPRRPRRGDSGSPRDVRTVLYGTAVVNR